LTRQGTGDPRWGTPRQLKEGTLRDSKSSGQEAEEQKGAVKKMGETFLVKLKVLKINPANDSQPQEDLRRSKRSGVTLGGSFEEGGKRQATRRIRKKDKGQELREFPTKSPTP